MNILSQYRGLQREVYVLFYGRVMTSMGGLVWPLMTLILSNKMGFSASDIATLLLVMSIIQLPCSLIGGKLADRFNKKWVIIICDMVTVIAYLICFLIPLSMYSITLFYIAGSFASIEYPSYDALVADLTSIDEREKAYSLNYLGVNLGLVLAPTIGGLLFANYLNYAFLITAIATFSSTLLIMLYIKNIKRAPLASDSINVYEEGSDSQSAWQVLAKNRTLIMYILSAAAAGLIYSQFNFLIPLNMEANYGVNGATYFGMLTSTNAFVVIIGTPIITKLLVRVRDIQKVAFGVGLEVIALSMYIFIQNVLWAYFVSIIIFTFGEIIHTLGNSPYITKRIPATHRGRISSITMVFATLFQSISQKGIAFIIDTKTLSFAWLIIGIIGIITIIGYIIVIKLDKRDYPLLYKN